MAEHFPTDILRQLICAHITANADELVFTPIPTGHFNTSYFVDGAGRPVVLRIAPPDDAGFLFYERRMMAQEPNIHRLVRSRTSAPVADIIAHDTTRTHIDRDYIIMERLPGMPLSQCRPTPQQLERALEQTGRYLRQIHDITASQYGYLGEHRCMDPQGDWASAFKVMWNRLVDDVAQAGYYDDDEESRVRGMLDEHYACFDRPVTSRLLHMDIWSQNILVDSEGNVSGIVDFDRALWGDKEIEFAVLDYCGISEPAFWHGYGEKREWTPSARIRHVFYLAYELQKYIVIHHYRHRAPVSAHRYKMQSVALLETVFDTGGAQT